MRRYCMWGGNHKGTPEDETLCVVEVANGGWSVLSHQCRRRRGYGSNGLLCKQHATKEEAGKTLDIPAGGEELVVTDYSASPTTLRRLANNMRVQQDFIEVEYELFDAIADKWEKDRAKVRELRAVITAHNERIAAACKWRQENGHCDYAKRGDLCPDCPREWEIEND